MKMTTLVLTSIFLGLVLAAAVAPARAADLVRAIGPRNYSTPPLDAEIFLWAIRQVESGDNPRACGPFGERTAYQFMAGTWRDYSRVAFVLSGGDVAEADRVARKHYAFIEARLLARGFDLTPEYFAAAWNFGARFPVAAVRSDYVRRVSNLYRERKGKS